MKKFAFLFLVFLVAAVFAFYRRPQVVSVKETPKTTAPVEARAAPPPAPPSSARVALRPRRPATPPAQAPSPVVEQARNLVAEQRPQDAVLLLEKEIAANPGNVDAHLELGFLYSELDANSERGEREFRRALEMDPNNKVALEELLQKYVANGRYDEGNRLIDQLKGEHSDAGYLEAQRGALLLDQGRLDEARATYERLAQNPAERERALPGLAESFMRAHEFGQAVSAYQEIVKDLSRKIEGAEPASAGNLQEQMFDTQVALVQALASDGSTDRAQALFQELKRESPEHPGLAYLQRYFR